MMENTQRQQMFESFFMDEIIAGSRELTLFIQHAETFLRQGTSSERIRYRRKMISLVHARRERIYTRMKSREFMNCFPETEAVMKSGKSDFANTCKIMEDLGFDHTYIRSFLIVSLLEIR